MGFFKKHKVLKPNCIKCSLRTVKTHRMGFVGEGGKGILIIGDAPTTIDDSKGFLRVHRLVHKELLDRDIDPVKDCWYTTAVQCTTYDDNSKKHKAPTDSQISCCRNALHAMIKELKPAKILLLGDSALKMFYSDRNGKCTSTYKMAGLKLWDSTFNAWAFPLWEAEFIQKKKYDKLLYSEFNRCFSKAIEHSSEPLKKRWNPVHKLTSFKDAKLALKTCLMHDTCIAIDYETTGLNMYLRGHKTVSFAWANDKGAWAVPVQHPCWTKPQQKRIFALIQKILRKRSIRKIVQGINFEYPWTKAQMKTKPRNFFWDTQLATHVLDGRTGITGLKFQCFLRWGIEEYDALSRNFIKSTEGSPFNAMLKMPLEALLEYNAKDALYTYELYHEQLNEFEGKELEAYKFMHEGAIAMCEMSYNGICINEDFYLKQKTLLEQERDDLIDVINESKEAKKYTKRRGTSFDYNSPKDLQIMLFDVLGLKSIKETKTGHSVDEEVLTKLDIPLTKNIIAVRKLNKMISTYIDGFLKRAQYGKLHPVFTLNRARSYRSSSQNPNWQNVPKRDPKAKRITRSGIVPRPGNILGELDFSGAEISVSCVTADTIIDTLHGSIPMAEVLERLQKHKETYVYSYSQEKGRVCLAKVTDGGITGTNKKVYAVTLDDGSVIKATSDHKFMLRDGTYKPLSALQIDDSLMPVYRKNKRQGNVAYTDVYLNNGDHMWAHNLWAEDVQGVTIKGSNVLVHHDDGDGINNDPTNLEIMDRRKHMRIHSLQGWENKPVGVRVDSHMKTKEHKARVSLMNKDRKENWSRQEWDEFAQRVREGVQSKNNGNRGKHNAMYGKKQSQKCKDTIGAANTGNVCWCKGKKLGPLSEEHRRKLCVPMKEETKSKISTALAGRIFTEEYRKNLCGEKSENHKAKLAQHLQKVHKKRKEAPDVKCAICHNIFRQVTNTHLKHAHGITREEYTATFNHKVVSIRRAGTEDVYNINVEGTHNYSANGIIIKNCYMHKDPTFIEYQTSGGGDMHKDASAEILMIKGEEVPKQIRQCTKGVWTFSQFYGSYYVSCAKQGWSDYPLCVDADNKPVQVRGEDVGTWMVKKFKNLKGFENHLKKFQDKFWNEWFKVYTKWKLAICKEYVRKGYIETPFGFRCRGLMDSKQATNYIIQGCLQGDSLIQTHDGWVPIKALVNERVQVWTGFKWAWATGVDKGKCQYVNVHLSSGLVIKCDTRHKFKNEKHEWVDFSDLSEGDYVALPKVQKREDIPVKMNVWFILGFLIGDGCLRAVNRTEDNRRVTLSISGGESKIDILLSICDWMREKFPKQKGFTTPKVGWSTPTKCFLHVEGRKVEEWLQTYGYHSNMTAHTKRVPESVLTGTKKQQASFMEGLWLADGSRGYADYRSLHMCNKELLNDVQILLYGLGYDTHVGKTSTGYKLTLNSMSTNHSRRKMPKLVLDRLCVGKEILYDGTDNTSITDRRNLAGTKDVTQPIAERIIQRVHKEIPEFYRYDTVKKIEIQETYDTTYTMMVEDELHQFVADGVICKNTSFHLLLYTIIEFYKECKRRKLKTLIVGQIHDSLIIDVPVGELEEVKEIIAGLIPNLHKVFPWMDFPMKYDLEISDTYENGGSFAHMTTVKL